ncbi:MAG: Toxin HigB-1 [Mycoplasmataceae bacterium]|nr:MAG: Toxin HigB-1 [Mycoplasmataceae bacterium]
MIKSFKDKDTENIFYERKVVKRFSNISKQSLRKLRTLDFAESLEELANNPGNNLHKLHEEYEGYWSIRINMQYRIIFQWIDGNAYNVKVCDYHK